MLFRSAWSAKFDGRLDFRSMHNNLIDDKRQRGKVICEDNMIVVIKDELCLSFQVDCSRRSKYLDSKKVLEKVQLLCSFYTKSSELIARLPLEFSLPQRQSILTLYLLNCRYGILYNCYNVGRAINLSIHHSVLLQRHYSSSFSL